MRSFIFVLGIAWMVVMPSWSQKKESKYIRQGNREFESLQFEDSEVLYRKALEESKVPYRATFNIADALYKQEKYEEAREQFQEVSGMAPDKHARSRTYHNLGNALLQNQKVQESIEAYKEALRNNPADMETKYNLAYAQNLLKNQQQQKNQDQNNDQNSDQNKDQNQDRKDGDQEEENNQNQPQDPDRDQAQDPQQQPQPQPNQLSKEDAQRILQALQNQENEVQDKVKKAKAAKARVKTVINW